MRGYPDENHAAFMAAAARLRSANFQVANPPELEGNNQDAYRTPEDGVAGNPLPTDIARIDIREITSCDGIVLLPGWEASKGVELELVVAEACGLFVAYYRTSGSARWDLTTWKEIHEVADAYKTAVVEPALPGNVMLVTENGPEPLIRTFESGATRNSAEGKFDYEGFLSPLVLVEFGRYMHHHRHLEDGSLRDSDNWQKGIPKDQYIKSLFRHFMDLWLLHRGYDAERPENGQEVDFDEALAAILFNAQGYWHELLKERLEPCDCGECVDGWADIDPHDFYSEDVRCGDNECWCHVEADCAA